MSTVLQDMKTFGQRLLDPESPPEHPPRIIGSPRLSSPPSTGANRPAKDGADPSSSVGNLASPHPSTGATKLPSAQKMPDEAAKEDAQSYQLVIDG